jgi:hypothetical protein
MQPAEDEVQRLFVLSGFALKSLSLSSYKERLMRYGVLSLANQAAKVELINLFCQIAAA